MLLLLSGLGSLIGLGGMLFGVTARSDLRRMLGLRLLQVGWGASSILMIVDGFLAPAPGSLFFGFALLVAATGVTAIQPKPGAEPQG